MSDNQSRRSPLPQGLSPYLWWAAPTLLSMLFEWIQPHTPANTTLRRAANWGGWIGLIAPVCLLVIVSLWFTRPPRSVIGIVIALALTGVTLLVSWRVFVFLFTIFIGTPF